MEGKLLISTCLLLIPSSVSTADWTLSLRLVSYYKDYSIVPDTTGTEYCCCICVNQSCCQEKANCVNPTCVNNKIYDCPFSLSFCAIQGSSSVCRDTSFFNILNSTTFGGTVGDLTNPIHLIMPGNLGAKVSNQDSIACNVSFIIEYCPYCVYHSQ
uniref:Tectonic domain-containing protein n=1 Tax=Amphimedon queenslandica TaxID=400682 RepID=A0A1X7VX07_AMPQE